jgi:hypothetical protein
MEQKTTILQDEKDLMQLDKESQALVEVWKRRFKQAEDFRRPYDSRNLRMYKIYRAYRGWNSNYAYNTNLMPPTGFEIIETVKPRLAAAKINTRILPTKKEDINSPSLNKWDNLIHYYFDVMNFQDKKMEWIDAQLKFGNGVAQFWWEGEEPAMEVCDNWLLYIDPQAKGRLKNARWIMKRSWKEKEIIQADEKERGEDKIYNEKLVELENMAVNDDPRQERNRIANLKMGQIDDATRRDNSQDTGSGEAKIEDSYYKGIELWECYDFVKQELVTIGNREAVIRQDENPYKEINQDRNRGNTFVDLPCISMPWEYYGMSLLEPVETTIYEIADGRNQAMDNIVLNLDPIRKVRKSKGYKDEDFKSGPGAIWWLDRADDVVTERPPEMSRSWIDKDEILRREIQTSLALSEYTQGMPKSAQEPMGKVELLLMQTNIRFSMLVRQMENAFTDMIGILIEMSQKFLTEEKAFKIVGKDFDFDEFTTKDKEVNVDARVEVVPKKEKSPEQEAMEVKEMYKMFVLDQTPPPDASPEKKFKWEKKKAEMERPILEKTGYEEYEDLLVDEPTMETPPPQMEGVMPEGEMPVVANEGEGLMDPSISPLVQQPEKIELLPQEEVAMPQATTSMTEPSQGLIARLLQRFKQ